MTTSTPLEERYPAVRLMPPAEKPAVDIGALRYGTQARVRALQMERQRLCLEALIDDAAEMQLVSVESDLAAAELDLERLSLARVESCRREEEAREQRRAAAMERNGRYRSATGPGDYYTQLRGRGFSVAAAEAEVCRGYAHNGPISEAPFVQQVRATKRRLGEVDNNEVE